MTKGSLRVTGGAEVLKPRGICREFSSWGWGVVVLQRLPRMIGVTLSLEVKSLAPFLSPIGTAVDALLYIRPLDYGRPISGFKGLSFKFQSHPQKNANESIKMINFIDVSCKDSFGEVLRLKKSNHFSSGSTTPFSDSRTSLTTFETSDFLLEKFADKLALLDPFPPGNEDVDVEADLREIELLLNHDPSTNFSPTITIDPNPKRYYEDVESRTPMFSNFDEHSVFDPGRRNLYLNFCKIDAFMDDYKDSGEDVLEILHNTTHNLFPEVFFDHEPQDLKDEPNNDLMTEDKVFDPGVIEKIFFPSYVRLSSKDSHCLFFTIVFSFGSEDIIFDPGIYAFHFSSLEPVVFESQMEVCSSTCFIPKDE
ncbi:hypothetical protein Tco_0396204 [Tanacetum coccineum]